MLYYATDNFHVFFSIYLYSHIIKYYFALTNYLFNLQEQKRREMILARELKKPVEDMVLKDSKVDL